MIKYSVIIPFHSNLNMLSLCMTSLSKTLVTSESEIIIVDNNSQGSDLNIDLNSFPNCRVISVRENLLYPKAVNLGAKNASGDYLLFCDADICVQKNFHIYLTDTLENQNIGFSSAKLLNIFTGRILDFGIACSYYNFPHPFAGRLPNHPLVNHDHFPLAACSACSAIRHDIFNEIGGFDDALLHSYSDIDLCLRLKEHGYKTICISDAIAYHQGASTRGSGMSESLKEDTKGIFLSKHDMIKADITTYLAESCEQILQDAEILKKEYFFLNLSTIGNPDIYIEFVKDYLRIRETSHINLPVSKRDMDHIHLLDHVPHIIRNYHVPILYFVDKFTALYGNALWKECRKQYADIVIDRNANILFLNSI